MSPEERQLITGLFERMRGFGSPQKDREAEALINQSVRAMPDAAYMLVQSVLVQEQGLQASQERIQELEERLRQLEGEQQPATKSGSFLGGFWGGNPEPRSGSVPQIGSRATPSTYERRSAWTSQDAGAPPPQAQQPQAAASNGGGFMRSALTTAAGVAGGLLVADGLRNMLGGAHASPATAPQTGGEGTQAAADRQQDQDQDDDDDDDADNDSGFDSGGELDI